MKLNTLVGALVALVLVSSAFAQAQSRALPMAYEPVAILGAQDIAVSNSVTSSAFADPAELVSIEFVGTSNVSISDLTMDILYSDSADGPFIAATNTTTGNVTSAIYWTSHTQAGMDLHCFPAKFAKFVFNVAGTGADYELTRVTALRARLGVMPRPQALVPRAVNMGLAASTDNTSATGVSAAFPNPLDFVGFEWDSSGQAGTRTLSFTYSNSADGPFVAWEDSGIETVPYQNSVATTGVDAYLNVKLFPAAYFKANWTNTSGASSVLTRVGGVRLEQVRK